MPKVLPPKDHSKIYNPAQAGGHSLRSWGERLKYPKDDFTDYDGGLCEEMITYCKRDVELTTKVYKKLLAALANERFSQDVIDLEHRVTAELELQRQNGFKIDLPKANELYSRLTHRMREIEVQMQTEFPPIVTERNETGRSLPVASPPTRVPATSRMRTFPRKSHRTAMSPTLGTPASSPVR